MFHSVGELCAGKGLSVDGWVDGMGKKGGDVPNDARMKWELVIRRDRGDRGGRLVGILFVRGLRALFYSSRRKLLHGLCS